MNVWVIGVSLLCVVCVGAGIGNGAEVAVPYRPDPVYVEMHAFCVKEGRLRSVDFEVECVPPINQSFHIRQDDELWRIELRIAPSNRSRAEYARLTAEERHKIEERFAIDCLISMSPPDSEFEGAAPRSENGLILPPRFENAVRFSRELPVKCLNFGHLADKPFLDGRRLLSETKLGCVVWLRQERDPFPTIWAQLRKRDSSFGTAAIAAGWRSSLSHQVVSELVDALSDTGKNLDPVAGRAWRIQSSAAEALGRIGPVAKDAVPKLRELLRSDNIAIRYQSAMALGRIGSASKPAIKDLQEIVESGTDRRLTIIARTAIQQINSTE